MRFWKRRHRKATPAPLNERWRPLTLPSSGRSVAGMADLRVRLGKMAGGTLLSAMGPLLAGVAYSAQPSIADAWCDAQDAARDVRAMDLVECIVSGQPVDLSGVRVIGDLDLRGLTVEVPFICASCEFEGAIDIRDSRWQGRFDLRGSRLQSFTADGAVFGLVAVLSAADQISTFRGETSFVDTVFDGRTEFDRAIFERNATFRGSRFRSGASFRQAVFEERADFSRVRFDSDATFEGAVFGGSAIFENSSTAGSLNVGAVFHCPVRFADSSIAGELSFVSAHFGVGECLEPTVMQPGDLAASSEDLAAAARGPIESDLRDFREMRAGAIRLDLEEIEKVPGTAVQEALLRLLEANAKSRGDLEEANNARFIRLKLKSPGILDVVFYRWIAGYFVRSEHPLFTLGLVAAIGSFARVVSHYLRGKSGRGSSGRKSHAITAFRVITGAIAATITNVWPPFKWGRGADQSPRTPFETAEAILGRIVFSVLLVTLANSIPAARELIESFL